MKKFVFYFFIIIFILLVILAIYLILFRSNKVSFNGNLKVEGSQLKNRFGQDFVLKGVSSHGIQWDNNNLININNLTTLRDDWNINVFRIAMYTEEDGYIANKERIKEKALSIIDMCIDLDIYAVIDWHILTDNNPNIHKQEAIQFFDEISNKYGDIANLIYEICNEPNGEDVKWKEDIIPYATEVINTIRKNAPKSIIIVGTENWSKNIVEAANNQLPYNNILYSFHFYAGEHGETYRTIVDRARNMGLPIIVSEWGTSTAMKPKGFYKEEAEKWIEFMKERRISWINWSFSNKDEATSVLQKDKNEVKDENLTEAGKFIKLALLEI